MNVKNNKGITKMKTTTIDNRENFDFFENILGKNILNLASEINEEVEVIDTGSINLNKAIGIGGYPMNKIIEIYGNESSGKTTLALNAIKQAQLKGLRCLYIDVENAIDAKYMKSIGIDVSKLLIAHPTSGEQVFEIIELMLKNNKIDLFVVDSVAAMVPEVEKEANVDEQQMGLHARLMSKGLRRIQSLMIHHNATLIFINQIREKIGVFFGNPEVTTGGKALKFYSSLRIETRKSDLIKDANNKVGIQVKATITKNKLSPPLKIALLDIYFQNGFDHTFEILNFAIEYGVINKSGSWYSFQDEKIGQGMEQLKRRIKEDPELFEKIKTITIEKIK
ncbi:MAG: recombinase RecA [Mycoplasma sp.]